MEGRFVTRKDYVRIAQALRRSKPHEESSDWTKIQWERDVLEITEALRRDSESFDKKKFLDACEVK